MNTKQTLFYFAPTIGWLVLCSIYFVSSVGFANLFAQLPFEVFISMFVVCLVPIGNWLLYMLDMRKPIPKDADVIDEAMETMAKVSNDYKEVYGLPDKKTIPEVLAEQKRSGEDIPVESLGAGLKRLATE